MWRVYRERNADGGRGKARRERGGGADRADASGARVPRVAAVSLYAYARRLPWLRFRADDLRALLLRAIVAELAVPRFRGRMGRQCAGQSERARTAGVRAGAYAPGSAARAAHLYEQHHRPIPVA